MNRLILAAVTAVGLGALGESTLLAQPQRPGFPPQRPNTNPFGRPTVNPIVQLNRSGNRSGISYFAIVRPQQEATAGIQSLQNELATQSPASAAPTTEGGAGGLPRFFYYSHYYGYYPYNLPPVRGPVR